MYAVKERVCATYNTVPFTHISAQMVVEMVYLIIFDLNNFPHHCGMSDNLSLQIIVADQKIDYHLHCKYKLGIYVQIHEEHDSSMDRKQLEHWQYILPETHKEILTILILLQAKSLIACMQQNCQCQPRELTH